MSGANAIEVQNVSAVYPGADEAKVLDDVSFSIARGEKVALIGANGAGKSTLLLALVGVVPISAGEITVNNIRLEKKSLPAVRREAGLVFQNPDDQLFMSTVREDVMFGPRNYGDANAEEAAAAVLEELGIMHLRDKMPHKLSGGEKRLAALAAVLVMKPSILLLDEPTAFLDPRGRRRLIAILEKLPQTMLITTHNFDLARALCPRTMLLHEGRVRASGPTEDILRDDALLESCGL